MWFKTEFKSINLVWFPLPVNQEEKQQEQTSKLKVRPVLLTAVLAHTSSVMVKIWHKHALSFYHMLNIYYYMIPNMGSECT